jgi:hemerythrin-like metal-binding protein
MESPFLAWGEIFAVGHEGLDAEHRHLIAAINEIHSAQCAKQTFTQLEPRFSALKLAAEAHFKHENSVMRKINTDTITSPEKRTARLKAMSNAVINEHIAEHAQALLKLGSIIHTFKARIDTAEPNLSFDLRDWFIEHAIKRDAHLKAVFQAM